MPRLDLSNFNIVCAVLGGFTAAFGLISFLAKEKFYLSEACMLRDCRMPSTHRIFLLISGSDIFRRWGAFWTSCKMDQA